MQYQICPNCEHRNLPDANYCFECGASLGDELLMPGLKPAHHHLLGENDKETIKPLSRAEVDTTRNQRESSSLYNAGLHCLRCSALNAPNAEICEVCHASLVTADEMLQRITYGSARTSVGQVRSNNEDTVGLWARQGIVLGLVADGMGGAANGEEASRLTKESIQAQFTGASRGSEGLYELTDDEVALKMRTAITNANQALLNRIKEDNTLRGMGTTATLGMLRGDRIIISHVGDSRAYLVNGQHGWIEQITDDHSFVEALLASGHITRAQAERHPMKSVLYRALGQNEELGRADVYMRNVNIGDRIILCSDGLPRHVTDHEIAQVAMRFEDPEEITQALLDLTNQRGAEDNVSVVTFVIKASDAITAIEDLLPIPGEREEARMTGEDPFSTGRIPPEEIEKARQHAAKLRQQKSNS